MPSIKPLSNIQLLQAEEQLLSNGVKLVLLPGGDQEVVNLQFILPAGRWQEPKHLVAHLTAKLLKDGTTGKSSKQINEIIDFYGAHIDVSASYDYASLSLVCLTKHLQPMLELVCELFSSPTFHEEELRIKQKNAIEKLKVNEQKTDYLAQRAFHQKMFGQNHPYGYASSKQNYEAVTTSDLKSFFQNQYSLSDGFVLAVGHLPSEVLKQIKEAISTIYSPSRNADDHQHKIETTVGKFHLRKEGAQQASIRIGQPTISIHHKDHSCLKLATSILGGYFGSRLMSNLREEKGLTYGVYSTLGAFAQQGYFYIGTDVGVDSVDLALQEIYVEIEKLQNELVPEDELQLVKNYIIGQYLRKVDGPFAQASIFKTLILHQQTAKEFIDRVEAIREISAKQIQEAAKKYWQVDKMVEIVC